MRALGPGSVSSLLKLVLDVIAFALWVALAALLIAAFVALLLPMDLDIWRRVMEDSGMRMAMQARGPVFTAGLLALAAYVGVVLYIVHRLQKIFHTLTIGDPFRPENVVRLRTIGISLAALEAVNYGTRMVVSYAFPDQVEQVRFNLNLTAWFAVLVVFVLAEVFREGARLRAEADLTI
ncbi:MAG TPA: DUF2975 domain-containing protein [Caulobacteraceae bacterium]|jgi:hypothetical protein